jgi:hypothetical protein
MLLGGSGIEDENMPLTNLIMLHRGGSGAVQERIREWRTGQLCTELFVLTTRGAVKEGYLRRTSRSGKEKDICLKFVPFGFVASRRVASPALAGNPCARSLDKRLRSSLGGPG